MLFQAIFRPGGKTNIEAVRFGLGYDDIDVEHVNNSNNKCFNIQECFSPANVKVAGKGEQTIGTVAGMNLWNGPPPFGQTPNYGGQPSLAEAKCGFLTCGL